MMTFIARMQVKPGKEAEFEELAKQLTEKVRSEEPGCVGYEFFRLPATERGYAVYESFVDEAAEEAHRDTPHFHELAPGLIECIDGEYVREFLDHLD
jgi:autoinducer 2-degrading protein